MTQKVFDPRTRLTAVMCLSSLAIIFNDPAWLAGTFVVACFLAELFRSSVFTFIWKLRYLIGIFIVMIFIQSVFTKGGDSIITFGDITLLTTKGLYSGLSIILRLAVLSVCAGILSASGSRDIIQGLYQCRLPYELVFMVLVSIRFLPVLKQEITDCHTAIQLRGIVLKELKTRDKFRIILLLIMPMMSSILEKARELAVVIGMRGFRAYPKRTSLRRLKYGSKDYVMTLLIFLSALSALYMYIFH